MSIQTREDKAADRPVRQKLDQVTGKRQWKTTVTDPDEPTAKRASFEITFIAEVQPVPASSVRAWEGAYRHYGRAWEWTARSPKGDPAAAREMASASWAVAAAWRADRGRHHLTVVGIGGHRIRRGSVRGASPQLGSTRNQRQWVMTVHKTTDQTTSNRIRCGR